MRTLRTLLALSILLAALPAVGADTSDCPVQAADGAVSLGGELYVTASTENNVRKWTAEIWQETNGYDGLQTSDTPCGWGEEPVPADEVVAEHDGLWIIG